MRCSPGFQHSKCGCKRVKLSMSPWSNTQNTSVLNARMRNAARLNHNAITRVKRIGRWPELFYYNLHHRAPHGLSLEVAKMASVTHLRAVILSTLNSPDSQDGNQQFFEELMSHKQNLSNLFNVGPRSPQEQRELESGQCTLK